MRKSAISVVTIAIIALIAVFTGLVGAFASHEYWNLIWVALIIIWAGIFCHTVSRGHEKIWHRLLQQLAVPKNSQVLDFSAGRLTDLMMIAGQLQVPGKVTGIADWQQSREIAKRRVAAAKLADRVKLVDGSMTNLPFANQLFDYVVIDSALHNITPAIQRGRALQETARVLKAHGTLVILDTQAMKEYRQVLSNVGFDDIQVINTGFDGWWGGPWITTKVLIAKRS